MIVTNHAQQKQHSTISAQFPGLAHLVEPTSTWIGQSEPLFVAIEALSLRGFLAASAVSVRESAYTVMSATLKALFLNAQ
tara:strand:- start:689 stop:928 length:240 start_codon:yes stop_codon:yes gene_type:complete